MSISRFVSAIACYETMAAMFLLIGILKICVTAD